MTGLMAGKRGLIMGLANDKSLAWGIAKKLTEHGAELAFSYQGEALKKRVEPLAGQLGSDFLFECDVAEMDVKVTEIYALLQQARGARWILVALWVGAGALLGELLAIPSWPDIPG